MSPNPFGRLPAVRNFIDFAKANAVPYWAGRITFEDTVTGAFCDLPSHEAWARLAEALRREGLGECDLSSDDEKSASPSAVAWGALRLMVGHAMKGDEGSRVELARQIETDSEVSSRVEPVAGQVCALLFRARERAIDAIERPALRERLEELSLGMGDVQRGIPASLDDDTRAYMRIHLFNPVQPVRSLADLDPDTWEVGDQPNEDEDQADALPHCEKIAIEDAVAAPAAPPVEPTPPAESRSVRAVSGAALAALLGEEGQQVVNIARSQDSADDKMRKICGIDRRHLAQKSPFRAELLGVSAPAVRKTTFWRCDRRSAIEADRALGDE